jgi:uncharacterized protein GlcG (DUF336 family)
MIRPLALVGVLSLATMSGLASAQQPAAPPARAPDMALALEAAQAAVAKCAADNVKAGASIVDSAGVLRIMVSADGASKGAVESSTRKAFTAATLKSATLDVLKKMETDAALKAKLDADTTLFVRPGGLPLMVGSDVIGAIGVGGAQTLNGVPGGERDAACAKAGIEKVQARLK